MPSNDTADAIVSRTVTRRDLLGACSAGALASLAGCSALSGSGGDGGLLGGDGDENSQEVTPIAAEAAKNNVKYPRDVDIVNNHDETHEVRVVVTEDGTTKFDRAVELSPGGEEEYIDLFAKRGTYELKTVVDGDRSATITVTVDDDNADVDVSIFASGKLNVDQATCTTRDCS